MKQLLSLAGGEIPLSDQCARWWWPSPGRISILPIVVMWGMVVLLVYNLSPHLWYLPCLLICSAILLPLKYQGVVFVNITIQSCYAFLNLIGQSMLCLKSQDHTGRGSDREWWQNSNCDYRKLTIHIKMACIIS